MSLKNNEQLKGSLLIVFSAFFYSTYGIWARLVGDSIANFYQVFVRSILIAAILAIVGLLTNQIKKIQKQDMKWFALYAGAGAFTYAPYFYAFNIIGIGPSTLLYYASIIVTMYLAGIISFSEKMSPVKIASLLLAFAGLLVIFNFAFSGNVIFAALAAILSGVGGGIEATFTKKVSGKYPSLQIILVAWTIVLVSHGILSTLLKEVWTPVSITLPWLAILGFVTASICGYFLTIVGFKHSEPSVGAVVGLVEIIFGIVFGIILFHEAITTSMVIGGTLILIAAALPNLKNLLYSRKS